MAANQLIDLNTLTCGYYTFYLPLNISHILWNILSLSIEKVQGVKTITYTNLPLWIFKTNWNWKNKFFQKRLSQTRILYNKWTIFVKPN